MGATNLDGVETAGMRKILGMLDALRHSQSGSVIYRQVERMLNEAAGSQQAVERAYATLINQLLDAYLSHLRGGSLLQVQVKMLKARLQPPLTTTDLEALRNYVDLYATQIEALQQVDPELLQNAVEPLLQSFGISEPRVETAEAKTEPAVEPEMAQAAVTKPQVVPEVESGAEPEVEQPAVEHELEPEIESSAAVAQVKGSLVDTEWPIAQSEEISEPEPETAAMREGVGTGTPIVSNGGWRENGSGPDETQVDAAYRSHLDSKRRDIQKLQATLAQQVLETISQNEEFGVLLEVVLGELRQAGDSRELEDLRWTLIREIEKLTKGHHDLAEKLDSTHHYLQLIESDSRQLSDELTRVRLLSLTDELTGLPNRRAFLRRIEDEVARVQRYGFPLSLALIDLDHFKQINDKYGHAGGDDVLQIYSKNILSIFRHHDLVARYGGEEFAVLLPNTDAEGSLRALTKVKNRAGETRWQANGETIPVPTFSSGVSLYKPGETASAFIERADKALYRAKRLGRNRVELDATYRPEADSEAGPAKPGERHQRSES